jgi:Ser/Thr protein kinase RdoA (MazF antagonist)
VEDTAAAICRDHGLVLVQMVQEGRGTFTARVRDGAGRELVLKRFAGEQAQPVRAGLMAWSDSDITPRLVAEPAPDLLLLEWVPGTAMAAMETVEPGEAIRIGSALARLHRAAIPPGIGDVRAAFPGLTDSWEHLPPSLQPLAVDLTSTLLAAEPEPAAVLHGDVVPYNIILTPEDPRFIDPLPARGFPGWDLAKLAVSWTALGRSGILAPVIEGYGSTPPLLAELVTWIALVYLAMNLTYPASPLLPHLLPLRGVLEAGPEPASFAQYLLGR